MLGYKILEYKSIEERNGEKFIDLLSQTYNKDIYVSGYPIVVNKYYVARPDLISLAVYGDDKFGDIICKINGISNPFELNENDVIFIPNIDFINNAINAATKGSDFIQNEKYDSIEIKDSNNFQKKKNEVRSPNQQTIGENNYVIDKSLGIVFY